MASVAIYGAGIAGRVLHRELARRGVPSALYDKASFPRKKTCGGVLQAGSWKRLKELFGLSLEPHEIRSVSHHWKGKRLGRIALDEPMISVPRFALDHALSARPEEPPASAEPGALRVWACGGEDKDGEWIGFHGEEPGNSSSEMEMHYGRGVCLGIAPAADGRHFAFIVKKSLFQSLDGARRAVEKELGLRLPASLKGTGRLDYRSYSPRLAVGDAQWTSWPFLGLGMKHAIESASLLADHIARGNAEGYPQAHRRAFRRLRRANALFGGLFDSPFRAGLRPFLSSPFLYKSAYRWIH